MENENKVDYEKVLDDELKNATTIEPQETIESTQSEVTALSETPKKPKKGLLIILLIIIFLVVAGLVTAVLIITRKDPQASSEEAENQTEETTSYYDFEMPNLNVKIQLPESFENKILSECDNENCYIWGYTTEEKPDYITLDKNSPDFFPFFALNYSAEALTTEKYSFYGGDGAYGREDGSVLYLHEIDFENLSSLKEIAEKYKNEESLSSDENALIEKYQKIYEEIDALKLYFKDGFKYQDL